MATKAPTPQDAHNAAAIARATAYTAHMRFAGHPQTLSHPTLMGAAMLALIMHRDIAAASPHPPGLPSIYAIGADVGAAMLVPPAEWLPQALAHLGPAYTPHPDIAKAATLLTPTVEA